MTKNFILLIIIFYFLTLFQASFFIHLNLVLGVVILINLFEKPEDKVGLLAAFLGGIFLDIFSISNDLFFGFYTLISIIISLFIKLTLKRHVRIPIAKRF